MKFPPLEFFRGKAVFRDLSWSLFGGVASAAFLLFATVLAGRLLGPTEYGKFAAIAAVAEIISVFLIFGIDKSGMRHIAMQQDRNVRAQLITFSLLFFCGTTALVLLVYWAASPLLSKLLSFSTIFLALAFAYAFIHSLRLISNNIIRSIDAYKFQAFIRLAEAMLILSAFLLFYFVFPHFGKTFMNYTTAIMAATLFAAIMFLLRFRKYITTTLTDRALFREELSHAKVYFLAAILGILFGSLDRIVIGKYLGFHDLGIYAAYSTVALNFTAQLNSVMGNVFFPMFSRKLSEFRTVLLRVDRMSLWAVIPLSVVVATVIVIVMRFFGAAYELKISYIISFSLLAVARMIFSFNAMLVDVYSKKTLKIAMILGNLSNILFAGIFLLFVYSSGLSISLVVTILILYNIVAAGICKLALYRSGAYHAIL